MNTNYYELRCAVVEMFYETLFEERYTIGQAASRCLVEFRRETQGGDREELVVLSVLLSRVARHEPASLKDFKAEVTALRALEKKPACRQGIEGSAGERLREDLRFIFEKASG